MCSIDVPRKGVPSPILASAVHSLPSRHSTSWPIVMREGMAWGLMMMSGEMPSDVKGMSSCGSTIPITPFWPWRDESLSPILGMRSARVRTLTYRLPSLVVEVSTASTVAASLPFMISDLSRLTTRRASLPSQMSDVLMVLPMSTSPCATRVPGSTRPSADSFV